MHAVSVCEVGCTRVTNINICDDIAELGDTAVSPRDFEVQVCEGVLHACKAGCDTFYDCMVVIIVSHCGTYMVNMCDSCGSTCRDSCV